MTSVNVASVTTTVAVTDGSPPVITLTEGGVDIVTVITSGPQGPQGAAGTSGAGYQFIQSSSSDTWTINHNLGFKPAVDVYDSGSQQIQAAVSHTSVNQTVILLTASTAGFARLT